eukprot:COSAG01_NODE_6881_length_3454_cov_10.233979_2_plen_156_part_00
MSPKDAPLPGVLECDRQAARHARGIAVSYSEYIGAHSSNGASGPSKGVTALAPRHNQTAVEVGRRLVHEARSSRMRVHWVKVKGHSAHEGNDAADLCATWAINGGWSNIQPITAVMEAIKDGDWAQLLHVEAAHDRDYLDTGFVNDARPDGIPKS